MADFKLATPNVVQKFSTDFTREYVRESSFGPYVGVGEGNIIRFRNDLVGKGSIVHVPAIGRLKGPGVTGSTMLKGAEENLANYSVAVRTTLWRHGVIVTEDQEYLNEIDMLNAAKPALRTKCAERLRDDIIGQLGAVPISGGTDANGPLEDTVKLWSAASTGEKNAFAAANADRLVFGALKANYSATMSTALATIDATADRPTAAWVRLLKSTAKKAGASAGMNITPYRTKDGREHFVLFIGSDGFRDLENDATISQANRDARPRDVAENPIFQSGDLLYSGVIIREVPEMTDIGTVGASSQLVAPAFLCGLDAIAGAYTQQAAFKTDTDDYGHRNGVGIREIRGLTKVSYGGIQQMVTGFYASVADA